MAKPLPRIDGEQPRPERPDTAGHKPNTISVARLETPPASEGYIPRNVDVRMSRDQAMRFKHIERMLEDAGAELDNGTPVTNRRRVVLWMIENFKYE